MVVNSRRRSVAAEPFCGEAYTGWTPGALVLVGSLIELLFKGSKIPL